jgi:transcription elongation factor Elf1
MHVYSLLSPQTPILNTPKSRPFTRAETVELEDFDIAFSFKCPKCDYLNEEVSAKDLSSGNAECGMCETVFRVEGLDAVKITAELE